MINLLPPDYKQSVKYARLNVKMLYYCGLVLIVAATLAGIMLFGVSLVNADEDSLVETIEQKETSLLALGNAEAEAKALSGNIKTISALFDRSVNFSQLIQSIGAIIPDGARLTGLSLTGDSSSPLQITAITDTQALAAVLQKNIEDSNLFTGADILSINPIDIGTTTFYSSAIVTSLSAVQDEAATTLSPTEEVPEEEQD